MITSGRDEGTLAMVVWPRDDAERGKLDQGYPGV